MKDYKLSDVKAICEKMNFDCEQCEFGDYQYCSNFWACKLQTNPRLWQLEDKIKAETLIELPCKVGDTAWYVIDRGEYSTLCSTTVRRICIEGSNRMVIHLNATVRKIYIGYAQDDNAFLTKAEAEKRLEELRGKRRK